jgi:hypothetical protein
VATFALVVRLPRPFVWIWVGTLILNAYNALRARTALGQRLFLSCFGLSLGLALLEGVFATLAVLDPNRSKVAGSYVAGGYFVNDEELGYAPRPGVRVTSRKTVGKQVIYDVAYTITKQGVRLTRGNPNGDTWLFMGCSFMFGEGVNDDETLPAAFSADLGYRANVVNLAFHGYGPHQALRSLEIDRPRDLVHGRVKQVIYEGIWTHAWRAAGRDVWDFYGPRYTLSGDSVVYSGRFHSRLAGLTLKVLTKSDLFRFVLDRTLFRQRLSDDDIELYARILERTARLARLRYGTGFTVLYWDQDNEQSRRVLARLQLTGLQLVRVSDLVPRAEWETLRLPGDGHPTPEANRRFAAALAARYR